MPTEEWSPTLGYRTKTATLCYWILSMATSRKSSFHNRRPVGLSLVLKARNLSYLWLTGFDRQPLQLLYIRVLSEHVKSLSWPWPPEVKWLLLEKVSSSGRTRCDAENGSSVVNRTVKELCELMKDENDEKLFSCLVHHPYRKYTVYVI